MLPPSRLRLTGPAASGRWFRLRAPLRRFAGAACVAALFLFLCLPVAGQTRSAAELDKGKLLIAAKNLPDPNFARTVILLLEYNDQGALGIVLNRPTPVRLGKLLKDVEALEENPVTVSLGGPVQPDALFVLMRGDKPPKGARTVIPDVSVTTSLDLVRKLAKDKKQRVSWHPFAGYAGWGAGQLEGEMLRGSWHVLPATVETVFDENPRTLWDRLIARTTSAIARLRHPGTPSSFTRTGFQSD